MKRLFLFFFLFNLIICDNNEKKPMELQLNIPIIDKIIYDDSLKYYQLKIPNEINEDNILVFTVKQSFKNIKTNEEVFSDPNIYISKSNKFPSNREESDWYSEQYGNDILTIPKYALEKNEIFYIGMHCQKRCNFELKAYLSNEIEIELNNIYYIKIPQKSSQSYFIKIPPDLNYEELNVIANCPSMKSFKIFMSKNSPSSQNSYKVNPSWGGGYTINIDKKNENLCNNCSYHILLQSENEDTQITLNAYIKNHLTNIKMNKPTYDAVKKESRRCYRFEINEKDINDKEQIIIQTNLYSGLIYLHISGYNKEPEKDFNDIRHELYSYRIETSKIILLKKEDLERFSLKKKYERYHDENEKKYIYFCIYGQLMSSYVLNTFLLSKAEFNQEYNYISPGSELIGYLFKNDVTKYELLDYSIYSNTNITLNLNSVQGETKFYVFFSNENFNINKQNFENKILSNEILIPQYISSQLSTVYIQPENNKCYQNKKNKNNYCKIYILTKCEKTENNDICSFKISTIYEDKPILLSPKRTYFNFISKGKQDIYEILITEPEVNSLVVVLNTASGDAELTLKKKRDINEIGLSKNTELIGVSKKDDYIPDVIRITPLKLLSENLIGRYLVYVSAKTFSSYNLYFYTTLKEIKDVNLRITDVTASLKEGQIIKDYFPNDIDYKIYSYTPQSNVKKDIKIVLTRINVKFSFYIFKDFNKIKYKKDLENIYTEKFEGYEWASDVNNEITILKDDPKYKLNDTLYILVMKDEVENEENLEEGFQIEKKALMMYYIGVTQEGIPFNLYEGIENSETLSEKYKEQKYIYTHYNLKETFVLDIMVLNGDIDVYIDVKEINEEDKKVFQNIENTYIGKKSIRNKFNIDNYYSFQLTRDYFEEYCGNNENSYQNNMGGSCIIFIYITQGQMSRKNQKDSQYIITTKSSKNKGKMLLSGNVYQGELAPNSQEYFYIEEVKILKGCNIYVNFYSPGAEVYARIPEIPEFGNNMRYPNSTFYDYKGRMNYIGKEIKIPSTIFERSKTNSLKIQILITIESSNFIYTRHYQNKNFNIKYSIYFSSDAKRINQNIPYTFFIRQGEYHYYIFYFDSKTENIYISLSNMNGDADLYLNYGKENYPTPEESNWASLTSGQEYISINKEDKYFIDKEIKDISGYYTLLVTGITNTTYTLFISSFKEQVFPLKDNTPVNCRCEKKDDKCYFRYNNIFKESLDKKINYNEIIFTSEYKYGNGKMYAKIMKERELNNNFRDKNYISYFPNEKNFQFSNSEKGKRNYMKVIVDKDNYSKDSLILMTIICDEKTDAEITTASLSFNPINSYLYIERENTFYLKYNHDLKNYTNNFYFYSFKTENVFYQIHAYIGKAKVKIYSKDEKMKFSDKNSQIHISEFIINSENDGQNKNDYFNYISKSMAKNKLITFEIMPMSDFGFYIELIYDKTWVRIPINKEKKIFIKNDKALAFFDISGKYSSIDINFSMENCVSKKLKIYLKFEIFEKKQDFNDMEVYLNETDMDMDPLSYAYSSPNKYNYDYKTKIKNFMCSANINVPDFPEYEEVISGTKIVRALLGFYIYPDDNLVYTPMEEEEDFDDLDLDYEEEKQYLKNIQKKKKNLPKKRKPKSKESIVHVMVTSGINNIKRINLAPYNYYYSKTSLSEYDYQSEEIKIYNMDKIKDNDQHMIINLHSCSGFYDIKISSKIVNYDNNENDIYYQVTKDEGNNKYVYTIPNLNNNKHIYVSIKPRYSPECKDFNKYINLYNYNDKMQKNCSEELSYLINYYSGSQANIIDSQIKRKLTYRRENKIIWVRIPVLKNYEYNIFWTKNSESFYQMDSICALNQLATDIKKGRNDEIQYMENIELNQYNEFPIEEKNPFLKLFVIVVSRNIKTNELSSFKPLIIPKKKGLNPIIVIIYFAVIIAVYFFIKRLQGKEQFGIKKNDDADDDDNYKYESNYQNNRGGYSTLSKSGY